MANRLGRHLRAFCAARLDRASDAQLLQRFAAHQDEAAFGTLVGRYGPLVQGVSSRLLPGADADDVFQGTFLALARQSASIRQGTPLGAWLSGVAYRLALQVRRQAARRRRHEQVAAGGQRFPQQAADPAWRELLSVLDEELQGLAPRYRGPLVACYLQGLTQDEAARQLGWSLGTLRRRLQRGRELLHARLTRRGATLGAGLLASAVLVDPCRAAVPGELARATVRVAVANAVLPASGWTRLAKPVLLVLLSLSVALSVGMAVVLGRPGPERAVPTARGVAPPHAPVAARLDHYGDTLPPDALARLGTARLRPGSGVRVLVDLSGGKELLSVAAEDRSTVLSWWDRGTGKLLRRRHSPVVILKTAALSPDTRTLVLGGYDRRRGMWRAALYEAATGRQVQELALADRVVDAAAFTPDSKTLATAQSDQTVRLYDVKTGREVRRLQAGRGRCDHLAISPDGKFLATSGSQRKVEVWDLATGKERTLADPPDGSNHIFCFAPDSKTLATSASNQPTIRLWDLAKGEELRQFKADGGTAVLAFSPDGRTLASGAARMDVKVLTRHPIRLWEAASGKEIRRLAGHLYGVDALAFTRDGKQLLSGGVGTALRVWDVASGRDLLAFAEHDSYVNCVAYSPDGKTLATAGLDGTIRLWEPGAGRPARVFAGGHQQRVWHVAYSPDGRELVSWGHDRTVRFWNVAAGREIRRLDVPEGGPTSTVAVSPDSRVLALWDSGRGLRLVGAATGKEQYRLACDPGFTVGVRFSPDSRRLAVMSYPEPGGGATVLHLWDTTTGKEVSKWDVASAGQFVFSSDGRKLAGVDSASLPAGVQKRSLWVWDVAARKERSFTVPVVARVFSLAWSPDGRVLALGTSDGEIVLVELASGQVRRRLAGHHSYVRSLCFSPDGKTLASGSADTTALVWDVVGIDGKRLQPLTPAELSTLWKDLANADAGRVEVALRALAADPGRSVPFMKERLRPTAGADARVVARLLARLDSDQFEERQRAMEELRQLGAGAEPALREALRGRLPLEAHKRVERLLKELDGKVSSPAGLRALRALEALERAGTPAARHLLRVLSGGARGARLTEEARQALRRLVGRR
jgi:RNA polymerase sigma factor (sigma-70 family)